MFFRYMPSPFELQGRHSMLRLDLDPDADGVLERSMSSDLFYSEVDQTTEIEKRGVIRQCVNSIENRD
jgi:hypothetical protein